MKIIVYQEKEALHLAALSDGQLMEFVRIQGDNLDRTGEIRLGKVMDVSSSLSAAFVDIGFQKNAFLPLDKKDISLYRPGMEIPVQIQRMEEGEKGCRVTDDFTIPGRYLVISHGNRTLGVSAKITNLEERKRLKTLAKAFEGVGEVGYILRTESEQIEAPTLEKEAFLLYELYTSIVKRAAYSRVGTVLYSPGSGFLQFLRQYPQESVESIEMETSIAFEDRDLMVKELALQMPWFSSRVVIKDRSSGFSLADIYKIPAVLSNALDKQVFLKHGGYLFIEETEAAVVIDVNSSQAITGKDKEEAILQTNLEATKEIAHQLRLRNLSGIILIDYINLQKKASLEQVEEALKEAVSGDPHKVNVYGFTHLQLMELSRQAKGLTLKSMVTAQ